MRIKAFLLLLFIAFSFNSFSQQVEKFRAYESLLILTGGAKNTWQQTDILITLSRSDKHLKIYTSNPISIDFVKFVSTGKVEDGISSTYKGVDDNGNECLVMMSTYDNPSGDLIGSLLINYVDSKIAYAYRIKKN